MTIEAVLLDVGGVLLLPDPDVLGRALQAADVPYDRHGLAEAHYGGVRALDAQPASWPAGGAPAGYLDGFLASSGIAFDDRDRAAAALHEVFSLPAIDVWRMTTPAARAGLELLADLGLPVAVISNADGTVEAQLRHHQLAQVGPGPGLEVAAIVDSSVVGVSKPDPEVFRPAIEALDHAPERCAYVGDTVTYDVIGARAVGMVPVHLDPWGVCGADDHVHGRDLPGAIHAVLDPPH